MFPSFPPGKQGRRILSQPIITPCIPQSLGMTSSAGNDTEQGFFSTGWVTACCGLESSAWTQQLDVMYVSRVYASSPGVPPDYRCEQNLVTAAHASWRRHRGLILSLIASPLSVPFCNWFPCSMFPCLNVKNQRTQGWPGVIWNEFSVLEATLSVNLPQGTKVGSACPHCAGRWLWETRVGVSRPDPYRSRPYPH